MNFYPLASIVLALAVFFAYINHRFIRMQTTIAIMAASLLLSLLVILLHFLHIANIVPSIRHVMGEIDFSDLLLKGMLNFLLFAGALTIDWDALKNQRWEIGILSFVGTVLSTFMVAALIYVIFPLFGFHLPLLYCLLFGALISPTDPIAVLATFKKIGAPKELSTCVAGESLFNDGVGIVIFTTLYQFAFQHLPITATHITLLFLQQAIGGIVYGLILGWITQRLLKPIDDQCLVILVTIGIVFSGYSFALWLNISGPLAMVVSGIMIGQQHREHLTVFWEVIDELLNAILFLLLGFELLLIHLPKFAIVIAIITIPIVLFVRLCTVAIPIKFIQLRRTHNPYTIAILTWGGLRGALAVALALSLPASQYRDFILVLTYGVVAFSIIVQGLSVKPLARLARNA